MRRSTFMVLESWRLGTKLDMDEEIGASDVVIFYGPPYCGKTFFYDQHLSKSHVRVAPPAEFAADPDLTLRQLVISKVVSQLKKGKKIVIDDENASIIKRDSYVSLIKKKCPSSRITCLKFCSHHGSLQLRWQREFSLAAALNHSGGENGTMIPLRMFESDATIQQWTERPQTLDPPKESEGYRYIKELTMLLYIRTVFKLEVPCLFIQYEALFDVKDKEVSHIDKAASAITKWYENNPCGRVTILCDGQAISSGSLKDKDQKIRSLLRSLANEVSQCPVYLLHITDVQAAGRLATPPEPGMLAFLQCIHSAHLTHKATMYWYHTPTHMKMAHNAGVKHMKASRVFQHTQLAATSHGTTTAPEPDILKHLEITASPAYSEGVSALVPLYERTKQSLDSIGSVDTGCGRMLYMAVHNSNVLQRYQDLYAANATPVDRSESKIGKLSHQTSQPVLSTIPSQPLPPPSGANRTDKPQRGLPKWMLPKSEQDKDKRVLKGKSAPRSQVSNAGYIMNTSELIDTAKSVLKEAGEAEPTDEDIACHNSSAKNEGSLMDIFSNTKQSRSDNGSSPVRRDRPLDDHLPSVSKPAGGEPFKHKTRHASSPSGDILDDLLDFSSVRNCGLSRKVSVESRPVTPAKATPTPQLTHPGDTRTSAIATAPETTPQIGLETTISQQSRNDIADSLLDRTGTQRRTHLPSPTSQATRLALAGSTKPGMEVADVLASETVTTVPQTAEPQKRPQPNDPPRKRPRIVDTSILDDLI